MITTQDEIRRKMTAVIVVISAITLFAFWEILSRGFAVCDDGACAAENKHVVTGPAVDNVVWAFTSREAANWHPLTWMFRMLHVETFGLNARYHHLVSPALHFCSSGAEYHAALRRRPDFQDARNAIKWIQPLVEDGRPNGRNAALRSTHRAEFLLEPYRTPYRMLP